MQARNDVDDAVCVSCTSSLRHLESSETFAIPVDNHGMNEGDREVITRAIDALEVKFRIKHSVFKLTPLTPTELANIDAGMQLYEAFIASNACAPPPIMVQMHEASIASM